MALLILEVSYKCYIQYVAFVSDLFDLAQCFHGSPMLKCEPVLHSFS